MSSEISEDTSGMEGKLVNMTVTFNGDGKFTARMKSGDIGFPMEAPVGMGRHGKFPILSSTSLVRFTGLKRQMKGDNLPDLFREKSCRSGVSVKQISCLSRGNFQHEIFRQL